MMGNSNGFEGYDASFDALMATLNGNANGHHFDGLDLSAGTSSAAIRAKHGEPAKPKRAIVLEFPGDPKPYADLGYVIKNLILKATHGSLVGPSGIGKTSVTLDLAFHIAHGKPYHSRRVNKAPVLYVGYEGDTSLANRIEAAVRKHGDPGKYFARLLMPPTLNKTDDGAEGVKIIVEAARKLAEAAGADVCLIVLDTQARACAGNDENSATDAAHFAEHRVGEIIRQTGAAVMTVHHTGKDAAKGGRGSSADPAAHDFRVIINEGREFFIDKVRDGPDQFTLFAYDLEVIELRIDTEGDPVTACVPKTREGAVPARKASPKMTPQQKRALEMLARLYSEGKTTLPTAAEVNMIGVQTHKLPRAVLSADWKAKCTEAKLTGDGAPNSERMAFNRAIDALDNANKIGRYGDFVWLLGQCDREGESNRAQGRTKTHNVRTCASTDPCAQKRTQPYQGVCFVRDVQGRELPFGDPSLDADDDPEELARGSGF